MEDIVNQENVNFRDQLVGRMKERYPDREFDSQDGQYGANSLEKSIMDAFLEDEQRLNDLTQLEEKTSAFSDMLNKNPRAVKFMNTLARTGDPGKAVYESYGKEAFDAYKNGDASEVIAEIEADDAKRKAEDEAFQQQKQANIDASIERLDQWGNAKGLDDEQKKDTFMRFYNILCDAWEGNWSEELFEMGWKADHYDEDVANARHEGEVAGRNANINERKAKRQNMESIPPSLSGQGVKAPEARPSREVSNPWMLPD